MKSPENIALFDLDGTLCDYNLCMKRDLESIASPEETPFDYEFADDESVPAYIRQRIQLIRKQPGWWEKLPIYSPGYELYNMARNLGYKIVVLTRGPYKTTSAWTEKVNWVQAHLDTDVEACVTQTHKGMVYGKFLVDDYPDYIKMWLEFRPRGWVIMPAHPYNAGFSHPRVLRYDSSQAAKEKASSLMTAILKRNSMEEVEL